MHRLTRAAPDALDPAPPAPEEDPGPGARSAPFRTRRPALAGAALAGAALVGALASVGVVAATGNLGGDRVTERTVVREAASLPAAESPAPTPAPAPVPEAGSTSGDLAELVRATAPGVVLVTSGHGRLGSGFLVDDERRLLTNAHVVEGAEEATLTFSDGTEVTAEVLGRDESTDLAVLEAERVPASASPLPLGASGALEVGEGVLAIGNPFGLERTATTGIVSATERIIRAPNRFAIQNAIQTDAAINEGNSGGPLLDLGGRVVGINSQIATSGDSAGNVGIGFAVPIDTVRPVAESIIETGRPAHAWLGIRGAAITPDEAREIGVAGRKGVAIVSTDERGPAREAGLEAAATEGDPAPGADVIVRVDGVAVEDMADVSRAVSKHRVGETLRLRVLRDGAPVDVTVTLADRPDDVGRP
jgi:S1-C subfamily serine protease